jgi:hypothetical protein
MSPSEPCAGYQVSTQVRTEHCLTKGFLKRWRYRQRRVGMQYRRRDLQREVAAKSLAMMTLSETGRCLAVTVLDDGQFFTRLSVYGCKDSDGPNAEPVLLKTGTIIVSG